MTKFLDFERPIAELENKIDELRHLSGADLNIADEISRLQAKADKQMRHTYAHLSPWQKVQIARHPDRPKFFDYRDALFTDFTELCGDRFFAEDCAITGGLARFNGMPVVVMGHQKGYDTESRVKHNFGMPKPEGYRKAIRLMQLADQFDLPVMTFVDTAGAYPGIEAEERGQAEAIARCLETSLRVKVPMMCVVIGEGGSGGAVALAAVNTVLMLEHSVYSVISPEGCASILWRSATKAAEAAEAQKLTAQDLLKLNVIDGIIDEPVGGAHRFRAQVLKNTQDVLTKSLQTLLPLGADTLLQKRREKFIKMGTHAL